MNAAFPKAREIFLDAVRLPVSERENFLADACGEDRELRDRLDQLLLAHEEAGSLPGGPTSVPVNPSSELLGRLIGPYKLLQQIGEGGMGVVYMAEQKEPVERRVALKIIKPGMDSRQVIARFEAERQALALMDHQNIAKVFEAGTTDNDRPYFVMELVKGVPITKYCDEKRLSLKERLGLMIPVCLAIQHAHQKGIIHRDIKPTNVLIAQYDGRPVPKVIDFGVAKATAHKLTERTMFTELGQIIGTLEYMSPEQAELNQLDIDTRSDIYSLGVLLYELLTGTTPFDKQTLRAVAFHEMLRVIREEEPAKPSNRLSTIDTLPSVAAVRSIEPARLSKMVRGELDWIVMKALEKDRTRRYETAVSLSSDLNRYLNDEQVQACPPSVRYRLGKFVRRNKVTLATIVVVAVALIIGTALSTWQALRATEAEFQAKANETRALSEERRAIAAAAAESAAKQAEASQRQIAEANERRALAAAEAEQAANSALREKHRELRQHLYYSDTELAFHAWNAGFAERTIELLTRHTHAPEEENVRGFEWGHLWQRSHDYEWCWSEPRTAILDVLFSRDASTVALYCYSDGIIGQTPPPPGAKFEIKLFDSSSGNSRNAIKVSDGDYASSAVFAHNDRLVVLRNNLGSNKKLAVYDVSTGVRRGAVPCSIFSRAIAASPTNSWIATVIDDDTIGVVDAESIRVIRSWRAGEITRLVFSPDGKLLASANASGHVAIWDASTGLLQQAVRPQSAVRNGFRDFIAFAPDGKTLAYADSTEVHFWDVQGKVPATVQLRLKKGGVQNLCYVPGSNHVAVGCSDGFLRVWDSSSGKLTTELPGHTRFIAYSPDGKKLARGVPFRRFGEEIQVVSNERLPYERVSMAAISGSDTIVGFSCAAQVDKMVAFQLGRPLHVLQSSTGRLLHTLDWEPTIAGTQCDKTAISADGGLVAAVSGSSLAVFSGDDLSQRVVIKGPPNGFECVALSPDKRLIATGGAENVSPPLPMKFETLVLWNAKTLRPIWKMGGNRLALETTAATYPGPASVHSVAFSGDGSILASGCHDGSIYIWNVADGHLERQLKEHEHSVTSLAFSPTGSLLASTSWQDRVIKIWNPRTGALVTTLSGYVHPQTRVTFSPNGKTLASGGGDGIRLWSIATLSQIALLSDGTLSSYGSLSFSSDGKTLIASDAESRLHLWRAADYEEKGTVGKTTSPDRTMSVLRSN
jgi:serine/threonine protein kinase/WD40 repeat protein